MKYYCVNMEKDVERRRLMERRFEDAGIQVEFVPAFNAKQHGVTKDYMKRSVHPGDFGCLVSHFSIWKDIVKEGHERSIIFEDDVRLHNQFVNRIENLKLPDEWDVVYLEHISPVLDYRVTEDVNEGKCLGTMCYMISLECAKKLVMFNPVDWAGSDVQLSMMPIRSLWSRERLAYHDGLLNTTIALDISRIPIFHNAVWIERVFGEFIAIAVLVALVKILVRSQSRAR
jgi:hypothetical protein